MMKFGHIATRWSPLSGQGGTTSGVGASEMDDRALPPTLSNPPLLPIIAGALAVGIFVVDTASTLDMAIAVLYCVVVLMGASFLQRRGVLLLSSTCLALNQLPGRTATIFLTAAAGKSRNALSASTVPKR